MYLSSFAKANFQHAAGPRPGGWVTSEGAGSCGGGRSWGCGPWESSPFLPMHILPLGLPPIHAGAWPRPPPLPPQHQPEGRERPHSHSQHRLSLPTCRGQALCWATRDSTQNPGRRKPLLSLSTTAGTEQQLKGPSINRWLAEDVLHTCNGLWLSHKENNETMPFAAIWMGLENTRLSEVRSEKDKYHVVSLICAI